MPEKNLRRDCLSISNTTVPSRIKRLPIDRSLLNNSHAQLFEVPVHTIDDHVDGPQLNTGISFFSCFSFLR